MKTTAGLSAVSPHAIDLYIARAGQKLVVAILMNGIDIRNEVDIVGGHRLEVAVKITLQHANVYWSCCFVFDAHAWR